MKIEGIPEGWELVRIGRPKANETVITDDGQLHTFRSDTATSVNFPIVRKLEPVLDVSKIRLKKGWVAQDKGGATYWYSHKPILDKNSWLHEKPDGRDDCYLSTTGLVIPWREDVPWNERIVEVGE